MRLAAAMGLCLALAGCARFKQPDDMAYVISLSIDRLETGQIEIAAQAPTIVGGDSQGPGESDYIFMSAVGATFPEALDMLEATSQRTLNLSQMKTVIFSQALAREADFLSVLEDVQLTPQIYGDARFVVSLNPARELLKAQKAVIGMRLAQSVTSAIRHYQEHGYAPEATLADAYFRMRAGYSDPVGILAATSPGDALEYLPENRLGDAYPGRLPRTGKNQNEYFGCALFSAGRMVGMLTGLEEEVRGLIAGEVRRIERASQGSTVSLRLSGRSLRVELSGPAPRITVLLRLQMEAVGDPPSPEGMAEDMEADVRALFQKCQILRSEPFGLGEIAARQFSSLPQWLAYDWREQFPRAEVKVKVEVIP